MHNRIGCIRSTFLHYSFSNVSSNYLRQRMHSHIGCIFFSLHCVFSNVSSNHLPFSTVGFQMCLQCTCIRRCIITLVAFVWPFSTVSFQMRLQSACIGGCIITQVAFVWFFHMHIGNSFTEILLHHLHGIIPLKVLFHHQQVGLSPMAASFELRNIQCKIAEKKKMKVYLIAKISIKYKGICLEGSTGS